MTYPRRTFESFMQDIHAIDYHGLDDDMPDSFDEWLTDLDPQEYMDYAESYGQHEYIQGRSAGLQEAKEIMLKDI